MQSRTLVMGVVNATPDSFSDGGLWLDEKSRIAHGHQLIADGADLLDIGGESTRPGAIPVNQEEELSRVLPVIEALADSTVELSIDTLKSQVAKRAVAAGVQYVNDVSGGLYDPQMLPVVAELGVHYICQHWRMDPKQTLTTGKATTHNPASTHKHVVDEVITELASRKQACLQAGITEDKIILDPGIGFSKSALDDWEILRSLDRIQAELGSRLLVGVSRKKFLAKLLSGRQPVERDVATQALTGWCASQHVWAVRTHEVRGNRDVTEVYFALQNPGVLVQTSPDRL